MGMIGLSLTWLLGQGHEKSAYFAEWLAYSKCSVNAGFAKDVDEPWSRLVAQIQMILLTPKPPHQRNHSAIMACNILTSLRSGERREERKTKASSIFKASALLHRGPGWRCKPARLIESKL